MAKGDSISSPEGNKEALIQDVKNQLEAYGEAHGLRGLDGRVQRGLDPAGMLAVKSTRKKVEQMAEALGASMEDVEKLTNELHIGAIWSNAEELAAASRPDIKAWINLAHSTREIDSDINVDEFLKDLERVNMALQEAVEDTDAFTQMAIEKEVSDAGTDFKLEDGVPFSKLDRGFLSAALTGHKSAVVEDRNGLLFVGAEKLDFSSLEKAGLHVVEKEDRGRMATFYQDANGNDVVKKLYDGFAIIVNSDREVAKNLAKTGAGLVT